MMHLTKDVREALLLVNEGFATKTFYDSKNSTESRQYTITDGALQVRAQGKTSWADSRYDTTFVADEAATHRYLRQHLDSLDTEGVEETVAALAATRASAATPAPGPIDLAHQVSAPDDVVVPIALPGAARNGTSSSQPLNVDKATAWVGVAVFALSVSVTAAPHVKRLWQEQVEPRARRLRGKFAEHQPVETADTE